MPAYRFFSDEIPDVGGVLSPSVEEEQHIRVMRLKLGEEAFFVDGKGRLACARFESSGDRGRNTLWSVISVEITAPGPERRIMIPWMRGAKLDWIVEKVVELGVNHIQLFPAERSEEIVPKIERLHNLVKSALKQSGALWMPQVEIVGKVKTWVSQDYPLPLFFGSLRTGAVRLPGVLLPPHWIWCAGPEAGWTDAEEQHLLALGATPLRLCQHVLRAETAAISGVACLVALQADE
jgi:16S rRNA (uracil1498-N3)-methyltransferase